MTAWGVTAMRLALSALVLTACSSDEPDASPTTRESTSSSSTTTAPERPASTTTTAFDPASVEGEVEAAYLRSWDVYADAVYDLVLDEDALAEVYADEHLEAVTKEIARRIRDGSAAHVLVEHSYTVELEGADTAYVVDSYRNHQVLIDPVTKEPTEEDPDEEIVDLATLEFIAGSWRVTRIQRL